MRIFVLTNIRLCEYVSAMSIVRIYECLCDETRLRIIQLLTRGPLCVCHLQLVLGIPQARVSQHLSYLREREMVENRREGTWMIYSLPGKPSAELSRHLACLQDCSVSDKRFRADLKKLRSARGRCGEPHGFQASASGDPSRREKSKSSQGQDAHAATE
jgi:ArsR family transcriptional regulator